MEHGRNLWSADFFCSRPLFRPEISVRPKKWRFLDVNALPPPFIFSKNYVIPKVTCGLFKVSISVFGMGTGFSISCLVISKIAFFAKKSMSKMVRNFCFQKYWLFKEEKARKFLNVLGVNCAAQCSSSYTFTYSIVFGMGIEVLLKRKHFLSWILCSYSQQNHVFFLWKSCRKHYSQKCWLFRWV